MQVSKDTIVEVWKPHLFTWEMFKVTAMGYKTILSACWYLNIISYGNDWINYYQCDPQGFLGRRTFLCFQLPRNFIGFEFPGFYIKFVCVLPLKEI